MKQQRTPPESTLSQRPTIGFLTHDLGATWAGVVKAAQEQNANLLCLPPGRIWTEAGFRAEPRRVLCELLRAERVDGVITCTWWESQAWFEQICGRYQPRPVVTIISGYPGYPAVLADDYQGMRDLVHHLIVKHGYRKIAVMCGSGWSQVMQVKYQAVVDELQEHNVSLSPTFITPSITDWVSLAQGAAMVKLLLDERGLRPGRDLEALVVLNDHMALGAVQELQSRGIHVPQDIAVTGCDNNPMGRYSIPPLTTIGPDREGMGRLAVETLLKILAGEPAPEQVLTPTRLVIRRSCGCIEPSIQQIGWKEQAKTGESFENVVITKQEEILALMRHAAGPTGEVFSIRISQIFEAVVADVKEAESDSFLSLWREILYQAGQIGNSVLVWQDVLSVLDQFLRPSLREHEERKDRLYKILAQGRALVNEVTVWTDLRRQADRDRQTEILREIGQQLISTFDMKGVMDVLAEGLPLLDIPGAYLSVYAEPERPEAGARLMLAYTEKGRIELTREGRPFPSTDFVPEDLLPHNRQTSLVVEPLYFGTRQIGLMVFEAGPLEEQVYEILRGEISSALQGALLVGDITRQKYILDTFMNTVPDRIYFKDPQGRIIRANQAHAEKMGFRNPVEEIGKTDFDFFSQEQARKKLEQEQAIIQTGQPLMDLEETDNKGQWLLTTKMPLRDEHGEIIGTFGVSRDITELKKTTIRLQQEMAERQRAEAQLRVSEEHYRTLFERLQDVLFRVDSEGKLIVLSPSIAHFLGYVPEEVLGLKISERLCASPEQWQQMRSRLQQDGRVKNFELLFRCRDDTLVWGSVTAQWHTDRGGQILGVEGMIRDISAVKQLEQEREHLRQENLTFKATLTDRYKFGEIVGKSTVMQRIYRLIAQSAASEASILISGESGTGKELIAKTIHQLSVRKERAYVAVNCASIPETLFEREFFGHRKGAFTGATHNKPGLFDQAHQGVLFLDEVTELTPVTQAKLLRVLQDGSYTPLGSTTPRFADVMIIAATNKDYQNEINEGRLRKDFFYRISTVEIQIPPLRDRKEDLPLLIEHILALYRQQQLHQSNARPQNLPVNQTDLPGELVQALYAHQWPGNIRELESVLHRYLITRDLREVFPMLGRTISPSSRPDVVPGSSSLMLPEAIQALEKQMISDMLVRTHFHLTKTAEKLGIARMTLHRKIKQYDLISKEGTQG